MTIIQIMAFLSVLVSFGIDPQVIGKIQDVLLPPVATTTAITVAPVVQTPIAPIQFGSIATAQPVNNVPSSTTPVVQSPVMTPQTPKWIIEVDVNSPTVKAGAERDGFNVRVFSTDAPEIPVKVPVTVTTNNPDLPSSFVINAPKQVSFFCIAPTYDGFPNNGCKNEFPVSVGTFDFTFTVENVSVTKTVTVE